MGHNKNNDTTWVRHYFLLFVWVTILLAGCTWNHKNIPTASILESGRITLSWDDVSGATSYNIYLSESTGVTELNAHRIPNVKSPFTITKLEPGTTYYFIVTAQNELGTIERSNEISYTVTDIEGVIDFGNMFSKSEPDDKSLNIEKRQTKLAPEKKIIGNTSDSEPFHASTKKSKYEIIICFGDSLTFGTGASKGMDYPSQLERIIHKPIINKGRPGDTTAGALRRLKPDVLSKNPDVVLIILGGNDLKNGVSKNIAFRNLKRIVETIQKQGAKVIIGGLKFPDMDRGFGKGYEELAQQTGAILIPNILDGIVGSQRLMSDLIHPNDLGYSIISQRFFRAMALIR